jgi:hypothetical protein
MSPEIRGALHQTKRCKLVLSLALPISSFFTWTSQDFKGMMDSNSENITLGTDGISLNLLFRNSSSPSTNRCNKEFGVSFFVTK